MLFASRRTQQPAPAPRGSVPGSPTASSSSSLRGSAPGTPTSTRRAAAASPRPQRGSTPDPADGHGGGMPALRQGLGGGRVSKLAKSASATTTRAMAAAAAGSRGPRAPPASPGPCWCRRPRSRPPPPPPGPSSTPPPGSRPPSRRGRRPSWPPTWRSACGTRTASARSTSAAESRLLVRRRAR
ncbi:hypothetical protein ONE63_004802 [Megalurothrips usitatus]|uniref:Uncharacterized protein n=1 Tax=Megalurothrips usitatus TaxID=439358 RepID=A0AAV7X0T9_9NEOP|nr:hypothetical protein ONE63_004802 [Megalurothrips usitatus]